MASGDQGDSDLPLGPTVASDPAFAETASPPIGARPDSDKLVRDVARAKIANELFAKREQVKLGRYHLLELVGSGGMGVVWGAWDPELERRVAIKLVKATMQAARDRILLEGQALAKLSHPNVVPVYDVGVVEEQVYLVMEWIRGENLRAYCRKPRTIREIVALYRASGEGLFAAHKAGLIHRDFKPDNAMRGDDGRVRVLDFGLAREEIRAEKVEITPSSDLTRGAGTPRYMPPEQAEGGALTPAVDQYAFCVSLREQLLARNATGKNADIPGWLGDLIERGTALEADRRFPSMGELLYALSHDPATVWRRRLIAGGAVAAVGAAFVVGSVRGNRSEQARCSGGKDEIGRAWNDEARGKLVAHLGTLGKYGAEEAPRLADAMTLYAKDWAFTHRSTCLAHERGEMTPALYERNLGCLTRARVAFQTVLDVLSTTTAERLSDAVVASSSVPSPDRCASLTLATNVEPPATSIAPQVAELGNQIEQVRVRAVSADPDALAQAEEVVKKSEQLSYTPLSARAYLAEGFALMMRDRSTDAAPVLQRAAELALEANDDISFVEAYAREVFVLGVQTANASSEASAARDAIPFATKIAQRTGSAGAFARALLFNNLGAVRLAAKDSTGARDWFDRSLGEAQDIRAKNVELLITYGNRALVATTAEERGRLIGMQQQALAAAVGPRHPLMLNARMMALAYVTDLDTAHREAEALCKLVDDYWSASDPTQGYCHYELGWLADERGDEAEARDAMSRVRSADLNGLVAQLYVKRADANLNATASSATALAEKHQADWWQQTVVADAFVLAASCQLKLHRSADAVASLRRGLDVLGKDTPIHATAFYHRRLARIQALLAKMLASTDKTEAAKLAVAALSFYREAGGYASVIAELDRVTAGSP
jgi:tetratricopeptide (TPR) repeat protein